MYEYDISIVLLTFNVESYVHDALISILSQNVVASVELIIADDASSDLTTSVISNVLASYDGSFFIRTIFRNENLGNRGQTNFYSSIRLARGRYLAFLDGDDYWIDPFHLQICLSYLSHNPGVVLCARGYQIVSRDGKLWSDAHTVLENTSQSFLDDPPIFPLLGASMWLREGCPSMSVSQMTGDNHFLFALSKVGLFGYLGGISLHYRQTGSGVYTTMGLYEKFDNEFLVAQCRSKLRKSAGMPQLIRSHIYRQNVYELAKIRDTHGVSVFARRYVAQLLIEKDIKIFKITKYLLVMLIPWLLVYKLPKSDSKFAA
jgi:glycosyltransferase involved in cell wall biosynthesis